MVRCDEDDVVALFLWVDKEDDVFMCSIGIQSLIVNREILHTANIRMKACVKSAEASEYLIGAVIVPLTRTRGVCQ